MLDPLRDQSHTVPDDEDSRRNRDPPADVDQYPVSTRGERLHRVSLDGDHPQLFRPGLELVPDEALGEDPDRLGSLGLFVPSPRARRGANVDLSDGAVTAGHGNGRPRLHVAARRPVVP